jgi:hypothetical protein
MKLTRRDVPVTVATVLAVVVTAGPPDGGVSATVTAAGEIVPVGNPDPMTVTTWTPGCAADGATA